ncbi:5-formyltetrahydrofolate cyclo-ligase [bacterium]|nr:5-formyltetrahydrofolate cyclo-ligase [bacterium]
MDLFDFDKNSKLKTQNSKFDSNTPLAVRMRPRTLIEFVGQEHILGERGILKKAIDNDKITSLILYGPPGTGKTTLAYIIANVTKSHFDRINAVTSGISEIRKTIESARTRKEMNNIKTILFIDEIHRFNKAQQDGLMPAVENNIVTLIGASTHNPFFTINSPLLSRSRVFQLYPLSDEDMKLIIGNALKDKQRGLGKLKIEINDNALLHIVKCSDGDGRRALNALELGVLLGKSDKSGVIYFTIKMAEEAVGKKQVVYDKDEGAHYDTISAFIKSMRGSDANASLYWLAKMIYGGEDPRFIARRIVICASEDVGNADPNALILANAALQASEFVGLPEARIILAQAVTYIATAPKSNASYLGIDKALEDVKNNKLKKIPDHLKVGSYPGAQILGHGQDYKYAHNYKDHYVEQEYAPDIPEYYNPTEQGYERKIKERMGNTSKHILRQKMIEKRQKTSYNEIAAKSEQIKKQLFELDVFEKSKTVMFYVGKEDEVQTKDMVLESMKMGKIVSVPYIEGSGNREMCASLLKNFDRDLTKGEYGILFPKKESYRPINASSLDLIIVPGVCFDKNGNRIGRGGGYYDHFLKSVSGKAVLIGLAFDFQVIRDVPHEKKDIPVHIIITEERVLKSIKFEARSTKY